MDAYIFRFLVTALEFTLIDERGLSTATDATDYTTNRVLVWSTQADYE